MSTKCTTSLSVANSNSLFQGGSIAHLTDTLSTLHTTGFCVWFFAFLSPFWLYPTIELDQEDKHLLTKFHLHISDLGATIAQNRVQKKKRSPSNPVRSQTPAWVYGNASSGPVTINLFQHWYPWAPLHFYYDLHCEAGMCLTVFYLRPMPGWDFSVRPVLCTKMGG